MSAQNQTDPNAGKSQPGQPAALPDPNSPAEIGRAKSLHQAEAARMFSIPANLSLMMGEADLDGLGAKFYMDVVKLEAGSPKDPIERMLLEQTNK